MNQEQSPSSLPRTGSQRGPTALSESTTGDNEALSAGHIVIAGGTGFIGRALCAALTAVGYKVIVLSRSPGAVPSGASVVHWDGVSATGPWTEALRNARAVVNLCGSSIAAGRWTVARKRELIESRVQPSRALTTAIRHLDPRPAMLLQASGVGWYGTGDHAVDETGAPGADFLAHLAQEWEAALADAPLPSAALRFGVVLGRDGALPRMLLPFRLFAGGPIGDGRQWLSWIHVSDAVDAIRFVIEQAITGPVNVTAPNPVRNREFAAVTGRVLHRPAWLPTPAFALRLALGEQATLVCDGQQALPARLVAAGFRFRHGSLQAALDDLCRSV